LRIEIVEARYGRVSLDNQSRVNTTPLLASTLSTPAESGQPIAQASMDHALPLALHIIPGVRSQCNLETPGQTVGTSDLAVDASTTETVSGNHPPRHWTNYGNPFYIYRTGSCRRRTINSSPTPCTTEIYLSLNGLTSGNETNYATASPTTPC